MLYNGDKAFYTGTRKELKGKQVHVDTTLEGGSVVVCHIDITVPSPEGAGETKRLGYKIPRGDLLVRSSLPGREFREAPSL